MFTWQSPNTEIGPFVVGEKPAPLQYQYQDGDGVPINIVGYTVKFVIKERDGLAAQTFNGTLVDGPNGIAGYTWTSAEFPAPGHYVAELWIGNGGPQRFASILLTLTVRASIGLVPNI